jgi:hypothetical protein
MYTLDQKLFMSKNCYFHFTDSYSGIYDHRHTKGLLDLITHSENYDAEKTFPLVRYHFIVATYINGIFHHIDEIDLLFNKHLKPMAMVHNSPQNINYTVFIIFIMIAIMFIYQTHLIQITNS